MSRPAFMHIRGNRYGSPRPYNSQWRPYGGHPRPGSPWISRVNFSPGQNSTTNNDEHWCETCDRGFPTLDILDKHKQQHEKCNIDGCQFVAHPKVITKHIQMQHSSGLYKKICKLDNPEEIQKWREERKKKYPTRVNIEKKAAECKEKIERGEKMGLKQDRNKTDKSKDNYAGRKRLQAFDKNNHNHRTNKSNINNRQNIPNIKDQPPRKVAKVLPEIPKMETKNKLTPFTGILSICMDDNKIEDVPLLSNCSNSLIEEDEYYPEPVQQPIEKPIQEPVLCGALTSLMCDYGSSDDENDRNENNIPSTNKIASVPQNRIHKNMETINNINENKHVDIINNKTGKNEELENVTNNNQSNDASQANNNEDNSDNDSGPEEVKTVKVNIEPTLTEIPKNSTAPINTQKKRFQSKNDHRHINKYRHKVPSTLLQKLLHKEIIHERNIVLQCIRHIKKMNYFDKIPE